MPTSRPVKVLALCGSLRAKSFNRMALGAAIELAPDAMKIEIGEIGDIPLYNEDVREKGFPSPVERLRGQIAGADALLFATPEYNYSVPGVLKNAIDWASRPPDQPFNGKPAAILGASVSLLGTARAQYHLRQSCVFLNMFPVNRPEIMIASAHTKFDEAGRLQDDTSRKLIRQLLEALLDWTLRLQATAT